MSGGSGLSGPHVYWVLVGSFDDPAAFSPQAHAGVESQLPWVRFDDGLPKYRFDNDAALAEAMVAAKSEARGQAE